MEVRKLKPDELQHHGVKGQEWGVRNGPPYPLDKRTAKNNYKELRKSKYVQAQIHKKPGTSVYVDDWDEQRKMRNKVSDKAYNELKKASKRLSDISTDIEDYPYFDNADKKASAKYDKKIKEYNKADEDYKKAVDSVGKEVLGKYANKKMYNHGAFKDSVVRGKDVVANILEDYRHNRDWVYDKYFSDDDITEMEREIKNKK